MMDRGTDDSSPRPPWEVLPAYPNVWLRDDFAKEAMKSILGNMNGSFTSKDCPDLSELFYSMADAMMKAREPHVQSDK